MTEAEVPKPADKETEQLAARRARERARTARWDLDIAVFLLAVLIIVVILLFQGIGIEIVAPVALFGLVMVWLVGWRRGKQLYQGFYEEELARLQQALEEREKKVEAKREETVEERVQKALRKRLQ